ncbi:urease accessory protein UreD [uncultured Zobellia sp.]|uniref:urease accessory protein UreD n=1 Tax=uncultured Zobellia sp. TaxID=255433 RepID=UPI002594C15B|nr:urease accessory protein UreD [uncultured Zobellia sp.]
MISKVAIDTHVKNGITQLKSVFFTTPFKVVDIREDKENPLLELILMSSSPGILDGDELYFNYLLHENSQLEVTSQSFQRLFTMQKSAKQEMKITIKENAFLTYLPHPSVPHKESNFTSEVLIHLEKNASVIWGEIVTCGRRNQNEIFEFTKFHSLTKIYRNGKLVLFENLYLDPKNNNLMNIGNLEGHTHQMSLIYLSETLNMVMLKEKIKQFFEDKDCLFGVSESPTNGLVIKVLYDKGEKLMQWMRLLTIIIKNGI